MDEGRREMVHRLIKNSVNSKRSERGREVVNRFVEGMLKCEFE